MGLQVSELAESLGPMWKTVLQLFPTFKYYVEGFEGKEPYSPSDLWDKSVPHLKHLDYLDAKAREHQMQPIYDKVQKEKFDLAKKIEQRLMTEAQKTSMSPDELEARAGSFTSAGNAIASIMLFGEGIFSGVKKIENSLKDNVQNLLYENDPVRKATLKRENEKVGALGAAVADTFINDDFSRFTYGISGEEAADFYLSRLKAGDFQSLLNSDNEHKYFDELIDPTGAKPPRLIFKKQALSGIKKNMAQHNALAQKIKVMNPNLSAADTRGWLTQTLGADPIGKFGYDKTNTMLSQLMHSAKTAGVNYQELGGILGNMSKALQQRGADPLSTLSMTHMFLPMTTMFKGKGGIEDASTYNASVIKIMTDKTYSGLNNALAGSYSLLKEYRGQGTADQTMAALQKHPDILYTPQKTMEYLQKMLPEVTVNTDLLNARAQDPEAQKYLALGKPNQITLKVHAENMKKTLSDKVADAIGIKDHMSKQRFDQMGVPTRESVVKYVNSLGSIPSNQREVMKNKALSTLTKEYQTMGFKNGSQGSRFVKSMTTPDLWNAYRAKVEGRQRVEQAYEDKRFDPQYKDANFGSGLTGARHALKRGTSIVEGFTGKGNPQGNQSEEDLRKMWPQVTDEDLKFGYGWDKPKDEPKAKKPSLLEGL